MDGAPCIFIDDTKVQVLLHSQNFIYQTFYSSKKNIYWKTFFLTNFTVEKGALPLRWISSQGPFDCIILHCNFFDLFSNKQTNLFSVG